MSQFKIRRAAVLGAGTMGSRIAAHLANAGIPCWLLDVAPSELSPEEKSRGLTLDSQAVRNRIVQSGWNAALKGKPPALFSPELASLVTLGNFSDNMAWLAQADWIVEAVTENLDIKRSLFEQVERHRKPEAIVTSNTSGIPIHKITAGFSEEFQRHFLGTHFFNPPRYLKLLEIIPTAATDPALTDFMTRFAEQTLGKGVVVCKDTPNFIANRIGTYGACAVVRAMLEHGLTIEEVDALTGPPLGRPKSATFRTFDIVGLDVLARVAQTLYQALPDDPEREVFRLPDFIHSMLKNGQLGEKSGQGFYKRVSREGESDILALDYTTLAYRPLQRPRLPLLERASKRSAFGPRLRALLSSRSRESRFLWEAVVPALCYAAAKVPRISDDITSVDHALKWGFLHQFGPFETWDALGVRWLTERLMMDGKPIPPLVDKLLGSGHKAFYRKRAGKSYHFAPELAAYVREPEKPGIILLRSLKDRKRIVSENPGASLLDLGDGVLCLEFHTKMNTIDGHVLHMMNQAVEEAERRFEGLVIANEGDNFSVGANLVEILGGARSGRWEEIDRAIRAFQNANMRLRYSEKPVVVAPHNMTLGGACEVTVHADQVRASAELYIGFVEVGVGLIPAAGGCKEMVRRVAEETGSSPDMELLPRIRRVFELIGMAKVSSSALEARHFGILRERDHISLDPSRRIQAAKEDVLALAHDGYRPPVPRNDIPVLGEPGFAALKLGLHVMERGGYISEYDKLVATHLARILTGGSLLGVSRVSEQYLLDLEREAFLSLCGQVKTQERMEYMLKTGKPLRN